MLRRCDGARPLTQRTLSAAFLSLLLVMSTISVVVASSASDAGAGESCDLVQRPPASLSITDDSAGSYMVGFALDEAGVDAVEQVRVLARIALANHQPETVAAVMAYLDSIADWYRYLDDPCADAVAYPGPFTNRPDVPGAVYGFEGVDIEAPPSFVITVTGGGDGAVDAVDSFVVQVADTSDAATDDASSDGPALAHSGSESFVLAYFGAGLLAFGATALGMRRWMGGPEPDDRDV